MITFIQIFGLIFLKISRTTGQAATLVDELPLTYWQTRYSYSVGGLKPWPRNSLTWLTFVMVFFRLCKEMLL